MIIITIIIIIITTIIITTTTTIIIIMVFIMEPHLVISSGGKIATACSLPGKINPTRPVRVPVGQDL